MPIVRKRLNMYPIALSPAQGMARAIVASHFCDRNSYIGWELVLGTVHYFVRCKLEHSDVEFAIV